MARILVIDDNPDNAKLVQQFLQWAGYQNVHIYLDPEEGARAVENDAPDLLLLDLHMPGLSGYEVLQRIRKNSRNVDDLPVLVFTADTTSEARQKALNLGASDFLTKPGDAVEIILRVRNFLRTRQMQMELREANRSLSGRVLEQTQELIDTRAEALESLARAAEFRVDETGEHARRVGELSAAIAEVMGFDEDRVAMMRMAAPLHDLGKLAIPDAILRKPGSLDESEMEVVRKHPNFGGAILESAKTPLMRMARDIAKHHHERWDGGGYPQGLKGESIPLTARIVAVADVYDTLTHDRLYKEAWTKEAALEEIQHLSETQFDPIVADALLQVLSR